MACFFNDSVVDEMLSDLAVTHYSMRGSMENEVAPAREQLVPKNRIIGFVVSTPRMREMHGQVHHRLRE